MATADTVKIGTRVPSRRNQDFFDEPAIDRELGQIHMKDFKADIHGLTYANREKLMQIDHLRENISVLRRGEAKRRALEFKDDPTYRKSIDDGLSKKQARAAASESRIKQFKAFGETEQLLNAQIRDKENKFHYGMAKSVINSAAQGVELLIGPARLLAGGEEYGMAYQTAARDLSYHDPDGVFDKYLNLAAANAIPMGTVIGAHFIPVIGPALGMGMMGSFTAADSYYDLRRQGVSKNVAIGTATAIGVAIAALEAFVGKALSKTVGKIPVVGKAFGSGWRADRIRAMRALTGSADDLMSIYRGTSGSRLGLNPTYKALQIALGESSTKFAALTSIGKEAMTEAVVGGVEEWLQTGVQIALTEAALKSEGLDSLLPKNPDGSIDAGAVLAQMNDAFIAGFVLEGVFGAGMLTTNMSSRIGMADTIANVKQGLRNQIVLVDKSNNVVSPAQTEKLFAGKTEEQVEKIRSGLTEKGYTTLDTGRYSDRILDYLSRKIIMESTVEGQKYADEVGPENVEVSKMANIQARANANAINTLLVDPLQTFMLDYSGKIELSSIADGQAIALDIGGKKVPIIKVDTLSKQAAARYYPSPEGPQTIGVSPKLWAELEKLGLTNDIIAIQQYEGTTLPHEIMHQVIQNLPADQMDQVLDLFNLGVAEGASQEDAGEAQLETPALAIETDVAESRQSPLRSAFKDTYARMDVATRGKNASKWSKKRIVSMRVAQGIGSSKSIDLGFLQKADRSGGVANVVRTGINKVSSRIARIGGPAEVITPEQESPFQQTGETLTDFEDPFIGTPSSLSQTKTTPARIGKKPITSERQAFDKAYILASGAAENIRTRIDAYSEKTDNPEETRNYLNSTYQEMINTGKRPKTIKPDHRAAVNIIGDILFGYKDKAGIGVKGLRPLLTTVTGFSPAQSRLVSNHIQTKLNALSKNPNVAVKWSDEQQIAYDNIVQRWQKNLSSDFTDGLELGQEIKAILNSNTFDNIRDTTSEVMQKENVTESNKVAVSTIVSERKQQSIATTPHAQVPEIPDFTKREFAPGEKPLLGIAPPTTGKDSSTEFTEGVASRMQAGTLLPLAKLKAKYELLEHEGGRARKVIQEGKDIGVEEFQTDIVYRETLAEQPTSPLTIRAIGKRIGSKGSVQKKFLHIGKLSQQHLGFLFPVTEQGYFDLFESLDLESKYRGKETSPMLHVGDMAFDLDNKADVKRIKDMTDWFGQYWGVVKEYAYLKNKQGGDLTAFDETVINLDNHISDITRQLNTPETTLPEVLTSIAGFVTHASQSTVLENKTPLREDVEIGKLGITFPIAAELVAQDLVTFFKNHGLTSDGSWVNFADLGQQYSSRQDQTEVQTEETLSTETIEEAKNILDTTLTAEAAAREFFREYAARWNYDSPYLQGDIGKHISPARIQRLGLNRQSTGFLTQFNLSEIGDLLNQTLQHFKEQTEVADSPKLEDQAKVQTLGVTAEGIDLLDKAFAIQRGKLGEQAGQNPLDVYLALSRQATGGFEILPDAIADYIESDPELTQLGERVDFYSQQIDSGHGVLDQTKTSPNARFVAATNLVQFQDMAHALKDGRIIRTQWDAFKMTQKWNDIFGIGTDVKMRVIIKDLFNTLTGKTTDAGITLSDAHQLAKDYSEASKFAINALNAQTPSEDLTSQATAIAKTVARLERAGKLNAADSNRLAVYKRYVELMPLADDIVNGRGEFGIKVREFIENVYKPATHANWKSIASESGTATELPYWSPRQFVGEDIKDMQEHNFNQITGVLLERTRESLSPHLAEGKIFKFNDFLAGYTAGTMQAIRAVANRHVITSSVGSGLFKTTPTAGYSMLTAEGAKHYRYFIKGGSGQEFEVITLNQAKEQSKRHKTGIRIVKEDVYAPTATANYFNRITKTSALRNTPFGMGLMATNAKFKALKIAWGMFHRRAFIWSAMMAGPVASGYEWSNPNRTFAEKLKRRFDYSKMRTHGMNLMRMQNKQLYAMVNYGMTGFRMQDIGASNLQYMTQTQKWLGGDTRGVNVKQVNKLVTKFSGLTRRLQTELFGIFGTTLKFAVAQNEYSNLRLKHNEQITREKQKSMDDGKIAEHTTNYYKVFPEQTIDKDDIENYHSDTETDIMRSVAGMANADFGGLNLDRLGISQTGFDAFRLMFLGPDWTASNIISVLKLKRGSGTPIGGAGTVLSGSEIEQDIYRRFWARGLGRAATLTLIIGLLMAGMDDETAMERIKKAHKRGGLKSLMVDISPVIQMLGGDKGTDHYANIFGHLIDPLKIGLDPVRMAYHKSSIVAKPALDLLSGTNYASQRPTTIGKIGTGLYTWDSNKRGPVGLTELPSYTLWQMIQALPIQARTAFEVFSGEQNIVVGSMKAVLGADIKQTY